MPTKEPLHFRAGSVRSAYLAVVLVVVLAAALGYWNMTGMAVGPEPGPEPFSCFYTQLNYYFRQGCSHCQQVARDGSLEKLEALGVTVNKYEVVEWGMYGINQVPVFEVGGEKIPGYKTLEEIKQLLECG